MGISKENPTSKFFNQSVETAKQYFEHQLTPLELNQEQLERQSLPELEASLGRINDAIAHSESFGVLRLKITTDGRVIITPIQSEAHQEIGISPLLLERKKMILERIALLKGENRLGNIQEIIHQVLEGPTRENIQDQLEKFKAELATERQQTKEVEQEQSRVQLEQQLNAEERRVKLEIELKEAQAKLGAEQSKMRTQSFQAYLNRETIATLIGAILLGFLTVAQFIGMFTSTKPTEIMNNTFLIILGYFFGQSVNKTVVNSKLETPTE